MSLVVRNHHTNAQISGEISPRSWPRSRYESIYIIFFEVPFRSVAFITKEIFWSVNSLECRIPKTVYFVFEYCIWLQTELSVSLFSGSIRVFAKFDIINEYK